MNDFSPEAFLGVNQSGANSTDYALPPEGEFLAVAGDKIAARQITKDGNVSTIVDIPWLTEDPKVVEATGRQITTIRQSVFIDLLPDDKGLDMSKGSNVQLGRLREAINQNDASKVWNFNMITGNQAIIKVAHSSDGKYANVVAVAKP